MNSHLLFQYLLLLHFDGLIFIFGVSDLGIVWSTVDERKRRRTTYITISAVYMFKELILILKSFTPSSICTFYIDSYPLTDIH